MHSFLKGDRKVKIERCVEDVDIVCDYIMKSKYDHHPQFNDTLMYSTPPMSYSDIYFFQLQL